MSVAPKCVRRVSIRLLEVLRAWDWLGLPWSLFGGKNGGKGRRQEGNGSFGIQDLCLRQELLEYMDIHDNDVSESSQPSWEKMCTSGT
ncbi:hypothetical protein Tco_0626732 [Tanacetum coccineum]|uniref:Uncharacterized protein n=1 Tax=Tanacetum coccineum TaxID=301880 RepID=A0ABQ4WKF4_9ASTR